MMVVTTRPLARTTIGTLVGFAVGFVVATALSMGVDLIDHALFPTRVNIISLERAAQLLDRAYAIWTDSLFGLALACAGGAVVGSWVASRISPGSYVALVTVSGAFLILGVAQAVLIAEHSVLIFGVAVALFALCLYLGSRPPSLRRTLLRVWLTIVNLVIAFLLADAAAQTYTNAAKYGYLSYPEWKIGVGKYVAEVAILGALTLAVIFAKGRAWTLVLWMESIALVMCLAGGLLSQSFGH